jgi:hypothetical protein
MKAWLSSIVFTEFSMNSNQIWLSAGTARLENVAHALLKSTVDHD